VSTVGNCVVIRLSWRPLNADADRQLFEVLKLRHDKIREMADYRTAGEAVKAAKRLAPNGL
jgi:hypothetical protein